jgi:hypothetical protein
MSFQTGRAFEHVDKLAYEIGPRLAGSRGDQMAAEYIRSQFSESGLETQVKEFNFVSAQLRRKATAILFAAAFVSILFLPVLFSLVAWLVTVFVWRSLKKILPKTTSRNIIAKLKSGEPKKTVGLSAHFDSATCRTSPKFAMFIRFSLLPVSIAVLLILCARLLSGFDGWVFIWVVLAVYFLPLCFYLFQSGSERRVSPGANDNASGVAVLLEAAKILKESPPQDTEVFFITSGAEEQGLRGMRDIARGNVLPSGTPVLNLDCVGAGTQPYIVEGNGALKKVRTSAKINQALSESLARMKLKPKLWWAASTRHDHIPLLKAGYPATTLTFDSPDDRKGPLAWLSKSPNTRVRSYPYMHTKDDLPGHLDMKVIEQAGQVVLDFVKTI